MAEITPSWQSSDGAIRLFNTDCLAVMPTLGTVDLILADCPYGKVVDDDFDHEWTNRPAMLETCKAWLAVMADAMKANSTLYWFAWPSLAGRIEAMIAERLHVLSHIVWIKPCPTAQKYCPDVLRAPGSETERIIMAEHPEQSPEYKDKCNGIRAIVFESLRQYLAGEFATLGWNADRLNEICGTASMAGRHYTARSQWCLPTAEHYAKLQAAATAQEYGALRREYEDLRREYEDLRRPFNLVTGDQKTDLWRFDPEPAKGRLHSCQKPLAMMEFMVRISSRPGGTVCEPFAGSAPAAIACIRQGRRYIGIERDSATFAIARDRIIRELAQPRLALPDAPPPPQQEDLAL